MNEDVTLQFKWAGKTIEVKLTAEDFAELERIRNGEGEEAAWKSLVSDMDMSEMDKAKGAYYTLQDSVTFGKGDEVAAYTAAGFQALKNMVIPNGEPAEEVFQTIMRNMNDRIEAERLQRPVGVGLVEGVGGFAGGKSAYDIFARVSNAIANQTWKRTAKSAMPTSTGSTGLLGWKVPKELSAYSYVRTYPGTQVPRALRPESGKYRTFTQLASATAAGAAGAGDYGYWSGEGGLPMEDQRSGDRGSRYAQSAPWGALLGTSMGAAARYGPGLAQKGRDLYSKVRRREPAPSDSGDLQILIDQVAGGKGKPADYETAGEVLATTRLRDSLVPSADTSVQRTNLGPDDMLGDVGYFDPLTRQVALAKGGETVRSAEARGLIADRADVAADAAQFGREVDVRGVTARGLIDEMDLRRDAAYAGAERTADRIPIETRSAIHRDLMKSEDFDTVLKIAKKERGTQPGAEVGDDYPKTKKELLGGYRNIDKNKQALYEKRGWEVKVTTIPGAKDPKTGEPAPDKVLYRAFDPEGPGLNLRQINEINKGFTEVVSGYKDKPQQSAIIDLANSFKGNFVAKSARLTKAGQMHDETLRLKDAADETPATLLALKPAELAKKLKFDGRAQEGHPDGKLRSAQQREILEETLWDDISRQVRETKGRPSQALMDSVEVLMNNKTRFNNWKDLVTNAEKYGIARERAGAAYKAEVDFTEDLGQQVGGFGRRAAEFMFSAPFAATRALDRSLTKTSLIRNQAVNDAVVDILTKRGNELRAAERLIQRKIADQTIPVSQQRIIREILLSALGVGPISDDVSEMPYVGAGGKKLGMGLYIAGEKAAGLIPGVN